VCIYVFIYMYIHIHMYVCKYVHVSIHIYIYVYIYTHAHIFMLAVHGGTLRPMQLNTHCSNHRTQQKMHGSSPSAWTGLHDTVPSVKDTSKPARSTKKSRTTLRLQQLLNTHTPHCSNPPTGQWRPQRGGKGNNFMHGMVHPAGDLKMRHHFH